MAVFYLFQYFSFKGGLKFMKKRVIKYHGFHPSEFTKNYLEDKIESVLLEAPHGATVRATFSRHGSEFKGHIAINSAAGNFFAIASGRKIKEATNKMIDQLHKQMEKKKSQRIGRDSIRHLETIYDSTVYATDLELDYDNHRLAKII